MHCTKYYKGTFTGNKRHERLNFNIREIYKDIRDMTCCHKQKTRE